MTHARIRRFSAAVVLLGVMVAGGPSVHSVAADSQLVKAACGVPGIQLLRTARGLRLDRSGDIQLFTGEPDYVGSGLPHISPFDYVQDVPMFWYGPGYIRAQGSVRRPVLIPDIAPTEAELLNFDGFTAPDAKPMSEALEPASQRKDPPKLIVTYVWDAAGDVVLDQWRNDWPYLKSLIPDGTWYENATIASSPASTAQIHTGMGTGAFPREHGVIGHHFRIGETHVSPWKSTAAMPLLPTLADIYDRAMGNKPKVALSGTVAIHMGMESHGSLWGGGDRDIAILREADKALTLGAEGIEWKLTPALENYFEFPQYANQLPTIDNYFKESDILDGKQDKKWLGHPLSLKAEEYLAGFDTPARIPYQQKLVEEIITREGLGKDDVPDLLFVNNKLIDTLAHINKGLNGPEMRDAVQMQDRYLEKFVEFLNKQVGKGNWAMVLTADHGATPYPKESGAFVISPGKIGAAINNEFGAGTLQFVQPTQVFLDKETLDKNGDSLEDVSKFLLTLTKGETFENAPPQGAEVNDKVFAAAFPTEEFGKLPCLKGV